MDDNAMTTVASTGEPNLVRTGRDGVIAVENAGPDIPVTQRALKDALGVEKLSTHQSPLLRLAVSPSIEARRLLQEVTEAPFYYERNALDVSSQTAVETRLKRWQLPLVEILQELDQLYADYGMAQAGTRSGAETGAGADAGVERPDFLSYQEFRDEVGRAVRRGGVSDTPEAAAVARRFREKLFDPLKDKAIELGLLPDGVRPPAALAYLTRVYRVDLIAERRPEFIRRAVQWLRHAHPALDGGEFEDVAGQITEHILAAPAGRVPYEAVPLVRGPIAEITFAIPDPVIEDFMETDIEALSRFYVRTLSADVELAARFGRADLADQVEKVRLDYAEKSKRVGDANLRRRLVRRRDRDIRDIEAIRDRMRGSYIAPSNPASLLVRSGRIARQVNFTRLMGGIDMTAIADFAGPVVVAGLLRVFGKGLVPFIEGLNDLHLEKPELKIAGAALNWVLDSRALSIADIGDDFGRHIRFDRGTDALFDDAGTISLMTPWLTAVSQFSSAITATRVLAATADWAAGAISEEGRERLANSGIGQDMAARIAEQFAAHGKTQAGLKIANLHQWSDGDAAKAFRAAIDTTEDLDPVPVWLSEEITDLIAQLINFSFAATQRMLIARLPQRDLAALNGATLSVILGLGVYAFEAAHAGRSLGDDPERLLSEGVTRSGLIGWLMDINNIAEVSSRGTLGETPSQQDMSQQDRRILQAAITGPVGDEADGILSGDAYDETTAQSLRRLAPYQNLFYLRALFDKTERGIVDALGPDG